MPVPDFQTLMRPVMEEYATGGEKPIAEVRTALAAKLALTEDDLAEQIERGQLTFNNRVGWATTYLRQRGLLEQPRRGVNGCRGRASASSSGSAVSP